MFQVLRQANQRDGTYVLESTSPPFEKRDQAQFVRLACLRCREKKVRCTGDKDGCQRCRDKGAHCSYADSSSSSASSLSSSAVSSAVERASVPRSAAVMLTPPATEPPSTTTTAITTTATATTNTNTNINTNTNTNTNTTSSRSSSNTPATSLPESHSTRGSSVFDDNTANYDFTHVESDFIHDSSGPMLHDPFNASGGTSMSNMHPPFSSFNDFLHEPLFNFPSTEGTEAVPRKALLPPHRTSNEQATESDPDLTNCYSSHDLLQAFEAVEVCLVWTPRAPTTTNASPLLLGIDEMLTCQKEVLESCRARIQCKNCRLRSHDAVILMNICEKLLSSILRVKAVVDSQRSHDLGRPPSCPRVPSFLNSTTSPYYLVEQVMFQKQDNRHPQRGDVGRSRINSLDTQALDLGLGEWRVDDEDKLHVLASLLSIRMVKLKHVVQELEEAVMSNRWLVHATMVRDLSGYISKCQAGILDS
ncbi:putative transcription factor protein [Rosellinia necatrix]|uniref:Putative transcription factor protein n=1 Tax=Rosellinia necatrix TaxID=77044 RepID=A0A1W2TN13_ROSNE|nr:putative transcription factor protein [Rosellinia necatrix]